MRPLKILEAAHPKKIIAGTLIFTFLVSLISVPVAHAAPGDETTYYFLNDHLGSVDVVLDEQGNVVERRDYLPYGQKRYVHEELNAPDTAQGFTGKELDDEMGLHYYGARYYDAEIGRFITPDPLLLRIDQMSEEQRNEFLSDPQNLNAYTYAKNNPVKYVDPDGEFAIFAALIVAAVFVSSFVGVQNVAAPNINSPPVYTKSSLEIGSELVKGAVTAAVSLGVPSAIQKITQFGFRTIGQLQKYRKLVDSGVDSRTAANKVMNETGPRMNRLKPDPTATGPHTVFKRDANGNITRYETYTENPQNPTGFDKVKNVDMTGEAHFNKVTKENVPTPHTQARDIPGGVRSATPEEISN
ncbi:hypothetical protein KJ657_02540 [Patescibacteria group bacterium]|nr:hypothetical protein [Patescibacteria group bacterium]MBU1015945.1 hypothetical protein [Patescibacteria group bacterium]